MAQSWLVTGGSKTEKLAAVEKLWARIFPKQPFPTFDVFKIDETPVKIAQIREAERFLATKPVESQAKVLLLHQADELTIAAANAFLKTLEEPPGQSLIFLLTDKPYELPETILSRCQMLRLAGREQIDRGTLEKEQETARRLVRARLGERLVILAQGRQERGELLGFVQRQIAVWRQLLVTHAGDKVDQIRWFRRGVKTFLVAEKLLSANVNLKLVEGWLALFLPQKGDWRA